MYSFIFFTTTQVMEVCQKHRQFCWGFIYQLAYSSNVYLDCPTHLFNFESIRYFDAGMNSSYNWSPKVWNSPPSHLCQPCQASTSPWPCPHEGQLRQIVSKNNENVFWDSNLHQLLKYISTWWVQNIIFSVVTTPRLLLYNVNVHLIG